jgi:hypothetical protein
MLRVKSGKSRMQKQAIRQLHADLAALGYDGYYNRRAAFAREWKAAWLRELQTSSRGGYVPLEFQPHEALQSHWSEDWAIIDGERTKRLPRIRLARLTDLPGSSGAQPI